MTSSERLIHVHSVAEAYLYLMTLRCPRCGRGPVQPSQDLTKTSDHESAWRMPTRCGACEYLSAVHFEIKPEPTREAARSDCINPTSDRSSAIDVLGWLTLFQSIIAASERETDRAAARQLAREAAQCLDEALKFYEDAGELPGHDAFFTDESRQRFREHPQHFARSTWLQRRLMLPEMKWTTTAARPRRWWQFWRGGR